VDAEMLPQADLVVEALADLAHELGELDPEVLGEQPDVCPPALVRPVAERDGAQARDPFEHRREVHDVPLEPLVGGGRVVARDVIEVPDGCVNAAATALASRLRVQC
jgi:hypothetical protein